MLYVIYPTKNTSLKMATIGGQKHVDGYALYNTINLRIGICTCCFVSHNESSAHGH